MEQLRLHYILRPIIARDGLLLPLRLRVEATIPIKQRVFLRPAVLQDIGIPVIECKGVFAGILLCREQRHGVARVPAVDPGDSIGSVVAEGDGRRSGVEACGNGEGEEGGCGLHSDVARDVGGCLMVRWSGRESVGLAAGGLEGC